MPAATSTIVKLAYRFSQFGKASRSAPTTASAGSAPATTRRSSADLRALRDLGVIAVDFSFGGDTADAVIDNMRRFREDVLAKV